MIGADVQPEHASTHPQWVVITATALITFHREPDKADGAARGGKWGDARVTDKGTRKRTGVSRRGSEGRGERRRDTLPDKWRRRRLNVCCFEGMLRKQARSRGRIPHNTLYAATSAWELGEAPLWMGGEGWWGCKRGEARLVFFWLKDRMWIPNQ